MDRDQNPRSEVLASGVYICYLLCDRGQFLNLSEPQLPYPQNKRIGPDW